MDPCRLAAVWPIGWRLTTRWFTMMMKMCDSAEFNNLPGPTIHLNSESNSRNLGRCRSACSASKIDCTCVQFYISTCSNFDIVTVAVVVLRLSANRRYASTKKPYIDAIICKCYVWMLFIGRRYTCMGMHEPCYEQRLTSADPSQHDYTLWISAIELSPYLPQRLLINPKGGWEFVGKLCDCDMSASSVGDTLLPECQLGDEILCKYSATHSWRHRPIITWSSHCN